MFDTTATQAVATFLLRHCSSRLLGWTQRGSWAIWHSRVSVRVLTSVGGGDVCRCGGCKGMCGCWRSLLSAYVANAALEADLGGIEGGGPPPWKADEDITGPNSCTCTARPLVLATQSGTQVAHRYLSRPKCNIPQLLGRVGREKYIYIYKINLCMCSVYV